jgi:hypothetical protein
MTERQRDAFRKYKKEMRARVGQLAESSGLEPE